MRFYTLTSGTGDAAGDPRGWIVKGSNDGSSWKVLDERHGETVPVAVADAAFKLTRPGNYAYYRIEVTENGGVASTTLAEIELLSNEKPSPLTVDSGERGRGAGGTAVVGVVVSNTGDAPAGGRITVTESAGLGGLADDRTVRPDRERRVQDRDVQRRRAHRHGGR